MDKIIFPGGHGETGQAGEPARGVPPEQYRVILASIGDAVITTDLAGRVTFMNSIAEQLTGWPQDEAIGQPLERVFRIVNEVSRATVENPALRALREGVIVGLANSTLLMTRDGREFPIDDSAAPVKDEAGRVSGAVLVFRDISKRKQAEETLRQSEATLRALLESASDGLVVIGQDSRIVLVNAQTEIMFGYSREELLGQPLEMLLPERLREIHTHHRLVYMAQPRIRPMGRGLDLAGRRKDGSQFPVEISLSYLETDTGLLVMSFITDITQRHQIQQIIERTAQRIARLQTITAALSEALTPAEVATVVIEQGLAALEASAGSIALLDGDGLNLELLQVIGYPPATIEAWRRFPLTSPAPIAEAVRTGESVFLESEEAMAARMPELLPQRTDQHRALAAVPLAVKGRMLGGMGLSFDEPQVFSEEDRAFILAIARQCAQALERARLYDEAQQEIATRKETEAQLKTLLEEKEVLLKEVHHRVKNNLQAVSNLLYLQAAYITDPQVQEMFRDVQNRIKSIAMIHEKLYQTKDLTRINFAEYIATLVTHLIHSYKIDSEKIKLNLVVDSVLLDVDTAVPLGVIVNELVSNILKHAFPAGQYRPGAAGQPDEIEIELTVEEGGQFLLSISDNGVGLPEELDVLNAPSVGLQLVKMLAGYMQGVIEVEQSAGTTFRIKFGVP